MRPIFLPSAPERKPRTECAIQPNGGHDVGERRAFRAAQKFEDDGFLRAFARVFRPCGLLGRLVLLRRDSGRLWCGRGRQGLDGAPDPRDGSLAVGELLHRFEVAERRHAGEGVPDLDQPLGGPVGGELRQFLLARESRVVVRDLIPGEVGGDGVVGVNGK